MVVLTAHECRSSAGCLVSMVCWRQEAPEQSQRSWSIWQKAKPWRTRYSADACEKLFYMHAVSAWVCHCSVTDHHCNAGTPFPCAALLVLLNSILVACSL